MTFCGISVMLSDQGFSVARYIMCIYRTDIMCVCVCLCDQGPPGNRGGRGEKVNTTRPFPLSLCHHGCLSLLLM